MILDDYTVDGIRDYFIRLDTHIKEETKGGINLTTIILSKDEYTKLIDCDIVSANKKDCIDSLLIALTVCIPAKKREAFFNYCDKILNIHT